MEQEKTVKWPVTGELPEAEYNHATDRICVIGAGIYRGSEFPSLDGVYFVGDWGTGRLWGLKKNDAGKWQLQQLLHTKLHFTSGGEDEHGNLYITDDRNQLRTVNPEIRPRSVWKVFTV